MLLATKTLQAIEAALVKDQGAKYRGLLKDLMPLAGDAYSTDETPFRNHLGASLIGRECMREIWYGFRWCVQPQFEGRMLRLFNRGHLEEPRFIALLKMIDCQVWQHDADGKQFRINGHRGHFGGSLDAVATGIPDLDPTEPALCEFKTHGEKSFIRLVDEGVASAKPEHYVQMQEYMGEQKLRWALYGAVNKNTDHLHLELIEFNQTQFKKYSERAAIIIDSPIPPMRLATTPGFYKCKLCSYNKLCHLDQLPAKNCRTCRFVEVRDAGQWACLHPVAGQCGDSEILTSEEQRAICDFWEMNPAIKS